MADFFVSRSTVVRFQLLHNNCLSILALFDLPFIAELSFLVFTSFIMVGDFRNRPT
jgi:hypothetical protein